MLMGTLLVAVAFATMFVVTTNGAETSALAIKISCSTKLSGGEIGECKLGVDERQKDSVKIKVVSSNPGLVQPEVNEVVLSPGQESAKVLLKSSAIQIKTNITITASSPDNAFVQAQDTVEIFPALLTSVRLSAPSFIGTHGAKIRCEVRLRAAAPAGGIQLYLSPITGNGRTTLRIDNPTVPAGKDSASFDVAYDALYVNDYQVSDFPGQTDFNTAARKLELVVGLDPQFTVPWTTIPASAIKVSFDVIPLVVSSLSVQPTAFKGGVEALASLTLNAPPGNSERIRLHPTNNVVRKVWVTPLGTSCANVTSSSFEKQHVEIDLVAGTTTYSFKVCSASVTSITSENIATQLRSGTTRATVTVQP